MSTERVVKFRCFDKIENRLYHHFDLPDQYLIGLDGIFWDTKGPDDFGTGLGAVVHGRFILQQFTGLHDKSGKEIYEGDVVEATIHAKTGERTSTYKRQRNTFSIYSDIQAVGVVTMDANGYWFWKSDKTVTYNTGFWRGLGRTKSEIRANESVPTTDNLSEPLYKILKTAEIIGHIYSPPETKSLQS